MVGALVAATGLVGYYRLQGRSIPIPALSLVTLCIGYATLIRANAAFSTVPLSVLMAPQRWSPLRRLGVTLVGIAAVLGLSQPINLHLLGARDSGVRRSEPVYDLAAIVKPLFWDSLGGKPACSQAMAALEHRPANGLYIDLARAVVHHPVAYLLHRLAHLNSTSRWLVPFHWPLANPPAASEPNDVSLGNPRCCAAIDWQIWAAGTASETPLGWPIVWLIAAIWGLWVAARQPQDSRRDLGIALLGSALVQELSFAAISVSSDLRYHLWPIVATALACALLWGWPAPTRHRRIAMALLACVILSGIIARFTLPAPPARYADLLL
ncbi:MAG: hypothetical protein PSY12_09675 [bacterium]|nr:hypothetical protein [bacterium]